VPFKGVNYNALMQNIVSETPAERPECDNLDAELWRVIERGLAKERDERWANMAEFGTALAVWLSGHGVREDASGNSLGAVWLERSLSDRTGDQRSVARSSAKAETSDPSASAAAPNEPAVPEASTSRRRRTVIVFALALLTCGAGVVMWAFRSTPEPASAAAVESGGASKLGSRLPSETSSKAPAQAIHNASAASVPALPDSGAPDTDATTLDAQNPSNAAITNKRVRTKVVRTNPKPRTPGHDFGF
jgi:hypothetical protein